MSVRKTLHECTIGKEMYFCQYYYIILRALNSWLYFSFCRSCLIRWLVRFLGEIMIFICFWMSSMVHFCYNVKTRLCWDFVCRHLSMQRLNSLTFSPLTGTFIYITDKISGCTVLPLILTLFLPLNLTFITHKKDPNGLYTTFMYLTF